MLKRLTEQQIYIIIYKQASADSPPPQQAQQPQALAPVVVVGRCKKYSKKSDCAIWDVTSTIPVAMAQPSASALWQQKCRQIVTY